MLHGLERGPRSGRGRLARGGAGLKQGKSGGDLAPHAPDWRRGRRSRSTERGERIVHAGESAKSAEGARLRFRDANGSRSRPCRVVHARREAIQRVHDRRLRRRRDRCSRWRLWLLGSSPRKVAPDRVGRVWPRRALLHARLLYHGELSVEGGQLPLTAQLPTVEPGQQILHASRRGDLDLLGNHLRE